LDKLAKPYLTAGGNTKEMLILGAPWHLSRAIRKYGPESFTMEALFSGLTKEQVDLKEVETIKALGLRNQEIGYNMTDGGDGGTGCFVPKRKDLNNEDIARLYRAGNSLTELGEKFSASPITIWKRLGKMGVQMRPAVCPRREDMKDEEIKELYELGQSTTQIANKLKTCSSAIVDRLQNMGVARRPFSRPKLKFNEAEAVCLYLNGFCFKEIGRKLGIHPDTVRKRFLFLGMDPNTLGEGPYAQSQEAD